LYLAQIVTEPTIGGFTKGVGEISSVKIIYFEIENS